MEQLDGFAAMGKPIPFDRKQAAYELCREFGLSIEDAWSTVGKVANELERDKPYEAMEAGMKCVDLSYHQCTGYRYRGGCRY